VVVDEETSGLDPELQKLVLNEIKRKEKKHLGLER
jgi:ABC-type multidrug transport system ATPase subunit